MCVCVWGGKLITGRDFLSYWWAYSISMRADNGEWGAFKQEFMVLITVKNSSLNTS